MCSAMYHVVFDMFPIGIGISLTIGHSGLSMNNLHLHWATCGAW